MSNLSSLYIKAETLETLLKTVQAKGEKGLEITISTNDETNQYGQNVTAFVSQSKEQRDEKKPKFYVGNGKVYWTDGKITKAEKTNVPEPEQETLNPEEKSDLPF